MEKGADPIKTSCIQFLVVGIISLVLAFIFEDPQLSVIWNAKLEIMYAGFLSSGIAYTLQIAAQKDADPTSATLIMSLESVFAAISGWLILGQVMSSSEIFGSILMFVGRAGMTAIVLSLTTRAKKVYDQVEYVNTDIIVG